MRTAGSLAVSSCPESGRARLRCRGQTNNGDDLIASDLVRWVEQPAQGAAQHVVQRLHFVQRTVPIVLFAFSVSRSNCIIINN